MIQERKEKEVNELVHLELIKTKYEHELKSSISEIMKISDLLKRSKEDNRFEETNKEAEHEIALTAEKDECEINEISQISEHFSTGEMSNELSSPEPDDDLFDYQSFVACISTVKEYDYFIRKVYESKHERPVPTKASKTKSKPYVTAYKKYTRSDILAALEEVKKGKSALQVSKQFNIPSRTLYDRAKKMGITTIRNMKKKSVIPQPYSMGGVLSRKKEPVMTEQHPFSNSN